MTYDVRQIVFCTGVVGALAFGFVSQAAADTVAFYDTQAAFNAAVDAIAAVSRQFLNSLETNTPPKNRAAEAAKARARSAQRFST